MKVLTDHSRMVEFHHPRAMGGLLWTLNDWSIISFTGETAESREAVMNETVNNPV